MASHMVLARRAFLSQTRGRSRVRAVLYPLPHRDPLGVVGV